MADTFLVADIGGTNTRVGLANDEGLIEGATRRFRNAENESFEAVLEAYIADVQPGSLKGACAGAAGPVRDGVGEMTNLSWIIDHAKMKDVTGAEVSCVINDLQAQGYALDDLGAGSVETLVEGTVGAGPRLVIGLGTGYNIVPVHSYNGKLIVPSCEAGHVAIPYLAAQAGFCDWLIERHSFASVERALAGQGIENLYEFHSGTRIGAHKVMEAFEMGEEPAIAALSDYGVILGAVTGDLGIAHLPFGGIYFTGGVSRSVTRHLDAIGFRDAMVSKGRFSDIAAGFDVKIITDDYAALKGCARNLRQMVSA